MVTNPINKAALYQRGLQLSGPYRIPRRADRRARPADHDAGQSGSECRAGDGACVAAHFDRHADHRLIVDAARTTAAALQRDFGIAQPRLAIAGLNPHAGEQGALGDEETTLIRPAIDTLRAEGIDVSGPWPPDTMFTPAARTTLRRGDLHVS